MNLLEQQLAYIGHSPLDILIDEKIFTIDKPGLEKKRSSIIDGETGYGMAEGRRSLTKTSIWSKNKFDLNSPLSFHILIDELEEVSVEIGDIIELSYAGSAVKYSVKEIIKKRKITREDSDAIVNGVTGVNLTMQVTSSIELYEAQKEIIYLSRID